MNMLKTTHRITFENYLFWLVFLLGLMLRFLHLGTPPLTDTEAKWALQALEIARGNHPILGGQPGYLVLTAVNFFIFSGSNFMARFWPALIGSGLVLVPVAFQKKLGLKAAIILSFALALDPGLMAVSRMAGSPILAIGFTAMCLAAWQSKKVKLAGFFGGMALLSGPSAWFGVLGLGITWGILRFVIKSKAIMEKAVDEIVVDGISPEKTANEKVEETRTIEEDSSSIVGQRPLKTGLTWGIVTIVLTGTLFLLIPAGLSAWAGSLIDFFRGWGTVFLIKPGFLITALLLYSTMALVFVWNRFWRGGFKHDAVIIEAGVLCVVFFLLAMIYPAHQVGDLAWMIVPLWVVAALQIRDQLVIVDNQKLEIALTSVMTFIFLVYIWQNLISIPNIVNNSFLVDSSILQSIQKFLQSLGLLLSGMLLSRILILLGAVLLMIMSLFLVTAIWDKKVAKLGSLWGFTFALFLYTINAGMGAAGLRIPTSAELWQPGSRFTQADLLEKTMCDLSEWKNGHNEGLDITVMSNINTPAVAWLLRDWHVTQVDTLSAVSSPALIILPEGLDVTLSSAYRKQNFVYMETPLWFSLSTNDWLKWVALREIPVQTASLVLWARDDLFSDTGVGINPATP
jgi:hypothetical protein